MTDNELKNKVMEKFFERANDAQKKAIFKVDGANLILAGAGSGKTATVCNRVMCMLLFGDAYTNKREYNFNAEDRKYLEAYVEGKEKADIGRLGRLIGNNVVKPENILTVTFTKKAANELKERVEKIGISTRGLRVGTFHSVCYDIVKAHKNLLPQFKGKFSVINESEKYKFFKDIYAELSDKGICTGVINERGFIDIISKLKNSEKTADTFTKDNLPFNMQRSYGEIKRVFEEYTEYLVKYSKVDFDDMLLFAVQILNDNVDVRRYYQNIWKYIMVDEYQDTNGIQYKFVKLLTDNKPNIMVVGDENQSIYGFRGADITHILNFKREFQADSYLLEQNYRSTEVILRAANRLIANNKQQMGKNLWTANKESIPIEVRINSKAEDEAEDVLNEIEKLHRNGVAYKEIAVLSRCRWVYSSDAYVRGLKARGIPYDMVGTIDFMKRKEVQDLLAFILPFIGTGNFKNIPRYYGIVKGVTKTVLNDIKTICEKANMSLTQIIKSDILETKLPKSKAVIEIWRKIEKEIEKGATNIIMRVMQVVDIESAIRKASIDDEESEDRIGNLVYLNSLVNEYAEQFTSVEEAVLTFMDDMVIDGESKKEDKDAVKFMTVHQSKGLEFDTVFVVGTSDNIMPMLKNDIEEERRIAYVAVTRAKKRLYLEHANTRVSSGGVSKSYGLSMFVAEMRLDDETEETEQKSECNAIEMGENEEIETDFELALKEIKEDKEDEDILASIMRMANSLF